VGFLVPQPHDPGHGEVGEAEVAEQEADQAEAAEQVLRPAPEAGQEFDRQEVEEALEEAPGAVLGPPEPPGAVVDSQLADPEAPRGGEHGDEAVQLAVEADLAEDLGAVALHAAVVVVQADAGHGADEEVEDPARPDLVPGVVADALPAADD